MAKRRKKSGVKGGSPKKYTGILKVIMAINFIWLLFGIVSILLSMDIILPLIILDPIRFFIISFTIVALPFVISVFFYVKKKKRS